MPFASSDHSHNTVSDLTLWTWENFDARLFIHVRNIDLPKEVDSNEVTFGMEQMG